MRCTVARDSEIPARSRSISARLLSLQPSYVVLAKTTTRLASAGSSACAGRRPRLPWASEAGPLSTYRARRRRIDRGERPRRSAASEESTLLASSLVSTRTRLSCTVVRPFSPPESGQDHRAVPAVKVSEQSQEVPGG